MSSYRTNASVVWKDNPLLLPDTPRSLLVQHLMGLMEMRGKGWFALAQFHQILLCGEECCPRCCEPLGSSASVGDYFKGWVCSVFKMFSCNKTLLLSVVDGKPGKQKHFLPAHLLSQISMKSRNQISLVYNFLLCPLSCFLTVTQLLLPLTGILSPNKLEKKVQY